MKAALSLALLGLALGDDVCSQYPTCQTCLNLTESSDTTSAIGNVADAFATPGLMVRKDP